MLCSGSITEKGPRFYSPVVYRIVYVTDALLQRLTTQKFGLQFAKKLLNVDHCKLG